MKRNKVLVLLAEGFEEMETVVPVDLLRRAEFDVTVASLNGFVVEGSREIEIKSDVLLKEISPSNYNILLLPGGGRGAENLAASDEVMKIVNDFNSAGKLIAAICASPAVVLAKSGVLKDKKAVCYPGTEEKAADSSIQWLKDDVVIDNNIITARGPGVAHDFALTLISLVKGEEKAAHVAQAALFKT